MRHIAMLLLLAVPGIACSQEVKGKPVLVLDPGGHTQAITQVFFTPDGKQIISVSEDKTIRFWDASTGEALRVLRLPIGSGSDGSPRAAALSRDGQMLAVAGTSVVEGERTSYPIYVIDLDKESIQCVLRGHQDLEQVPRARYRASCPEKTQVHHYSTSAP